jgi:hypothetical protein
MILKLCPCYRMATNARSGPGLKILAPKSDLNTSSSRVRQRNGSGYQRALVDPRPAASSVIMEYP